MNKIDDVKETEDISNEVFENIIRACFDENTENGIKYIKMYIEDPNIYHTWGLSKSYFKKELCYCSNSNNKCNCVTGKRYRVIDSITSLKYTESELYKFVFNNTFKANNYTVVIDDKSNELNNYNKQIKEQYKKSKELVDKLSSSSSYNIYDNYDNIDDDFIFSNANYSNKQDGIKISKLIQNMAVVNIMSGWGYSVSCDEYKAYWKTKLNIN